jgi:WD40 repeat protein
MERLNIFVSYSHKDNRWVTEADDYTLIPWLATNLRRHNDIDVWCDHALKQMPGEEYKKRIKAEIDAANMVIVLISQDFANSDFIRENELPWIKQRVDSGDLILIPILVGRTDFDAEEHLKWIDDRQMLPGRVTPLIKYIGNMADFQDVRLEILQAIRNRVKTLREKPANLKPPESTEVVQKVDAPHFNQKNDLLAKGRKILALSMKSHPERFSIKAVPFDKSSNKTINDNEQIPKEDKNVSSTELDLKQLEQKLSRQIEDRCYNEACQTVLEIQKIDRDNLLALDFQDILDKRNGISEICHFDGPARIIQAVFSEDGKTVLAAFDMVIGRNNPRSIIIWDFQNDRKIYEFPILQALSLAFSSDRSRVLYGNTTGLHLCDVQKREQLNHFKVGWISNVSFLPGEVKAIISWHDNLQLFDLEIGMVIRRFIGHSGDIQSLAVSPDGMFAVSSSADLTIRLWNIRDGQEIWKTDGHKVNMQSLAISHDGRYILSGGNSIIRLLDIFNGKEIQRLSGHKGYTLSLAFSPDGRQAISGGTDNIIRLWDLESGEQIRGYRAKNTWTGTVAFSPDGTRILFGDYGTIYVRELTGKK